MPVRTPKRPLQFLDDLAVAAHRAVEALQVAVHHQHQIVELLPGSGVDAAEHFRLVGFPVADEVPNLAAVLGFQAAALQILGEPRLIDGARRGKAHAGVRHLPKVWHAARMRIGAQPPFGGDLAAKVPKPRFAQPPFQEGAGIHPGRRVRLHMHLIAAVFRPRGAEDVVEAHLHHRRGGEVGGDVAADARTGIVCLQHHRHGVPAQDVLDAGFHLHAAGVGGLLG